MRQLLFSYHYYCTSSFCIAKLAGMLFVLLLYIEPVTNSCFYKQDSLALINQKYIMR